MFSKVFSALVNGIQAEIVEVETDISSVGLPTFNMVGLAETAVKESRDRVKSAMKNMNLNVFSHPITINLAPADIKKEGTHFDLPVAVGLTCSAGMVKSVPENCMFAGELSLDGRLRAVGGILPIAEGAKLAGFTKLVVPADNADEAAVIDGIEIYPFEDLSSVVEFINGGCVGTPYAINRTKLFASVKEYEVDFSDVKGQFAARRCAEIAAAGMHNLFMIGSPGSGKTMIARRIPTILPDMTITEAIETTKIYSVAGLIKNGRDLAVHRPFCSPHHTSSSVSLIGGTSKAIPGQVSLASNGVLFLDELLEFPRNVLETLRQPLEDREVTVARAGRTVVYPANFMLVAAANPCPCGYMGDKQKECTCTPTQIHKYRSRMSGPLMDRIDMHVEVSSADISELSAMNEGEPSSEIRKRVESAHRIQSERFKKSSTRFNSRMSEKETRKFCKLDTASEKLLETAAKKYHLSARSYSKVLKTARTIADLAGAPDIESRHLLEALQYRLIQD
ncbi:YifB family Mg chelatase-like AAA ATPase, partial [Seleniivibrio woodruffii]|uniref:YifB family Mg chelatase-like AAA ATPase n=1 Tax=Seleniivibrio woodruffii TaxID=1078050 RepID=UPI0039E59CFF